MPRLIHLPAAEEGHTLATFTAALEHLGPGRRVGVAVSGGGDSMALLAMTLDWASRTGAEVYAGTVDHGLRAASRAEAEQVAEWCARRGVPHAILAAALLDGPGNLSAKARAARYAALSSWAIKSDLTSILLGHTLDDQAETVLLRLARGSGIEGLAAIRAVREWGGVRWLRPLLETGREDLRRWLRAAEIDWIEDPTNEDSRYDRVKARRALEVLSPLGIDAEGLAKTAARLARQCEVFERAAAELVEHAVSRGPLGEIRLRRDALDAAPRDSALRVLAGALMEVGGGEFRPRFRALETIYDTAGSNDGPSTLGGCMVQACGNELLVFRETNAAEPPILCARRRVWDLRWDCDASGVPGAPQVNALGQSGLASLAQHRRRGWKAPAHWTAAPRLLRTSVPSFWGSDGTLLAVPAAEFLHPELPHGVQPTAVLMDSQKSDAPHACGDLD